MAESSTLLTYETGWQVRFFEPMIQSQLAGNYPMACNYGIAWLRILQIPFEKMPKKEQPLARTAQAELGTWMDYFNAIMLTGAGTIADTIVRVRSVYQKRRDIPEYQKPKSQVAA